jgi:hypothetical protein
LNLILTVVVGIVRRWFRFSSEGLYPEETALCSEASDKDALILIRAWIFLSTLKKAISA